MQLIKTNLAIELEEKFQNKFSFIPTQATTYSAGYDIRACIERPLEIYPGETMLIPLGFKAYINSGFRSVAGLLLPRSGLGSQDGIVLGNLVGLIDGDYQEEWKCAIWNRNTERLIAIKPGMKIAQALFIPTIHPQFTEINKFSNSTDRIGGFNSTGDF